MQDGKPTFSTAYSASYFQLEMNQKKMLEDQAAGISHGALMELATCDNYFVSGYDQLSKYGYAFTRNLRIRARLLIRLLSFADNIPLGAPMIIIKTGNLFKY